MAADPKRRAGHLMDPETLRRNYERAERARAQALAEGRPVRSRAETVYVTDRPPSTRPVMSIEAVRRVVIAVLVVTTLVHLTAGVVIAGVLSDEPSVRVGLAVIATATGTLTVLAALMIFRRDLRSRWSLWLVLGPVPGLVALWLVLR